jgi:hypothetical protein
VINVVKQLSRGLHMPKNIYQARIEEWVKQNGELSILTQKKLNSFSLFFLPLKYATNSKNFNIKKRGK